VGDVPSGAQFDAWRIGILEPSELAGLDMRSRLEYFAALALIGPTTHNTVPQRMRVDVDAAAIHFALDRRAILPHSDANGRQATVSLGACVANAVIAAEAYGMSATQTVEPVDPKLIRPAESNTDTVVPIVTIRFGDRTRTDAHDLGVVHAMVQRKMVRAEFDERVKLESSLADELSTLTRSTHAGLTLHILTDAPTLLALGKFQELADSTVINRASFAHELGEWLLANDSDAYVGMRGREFGLDDASAIRFRNGLAGTGPLLPDETVGFAKSGNIGMRSASAVLVIAAAKDDLEHRLAAGYAYEAMALRLVQAGMSVAMHAGITEVEAPNMALRGRLRTMQRPTVVFRAGKPLRQSDAERPHSSRPRLVDAMY
jgi:hypothetical protein